MMYQLEKNDGCWVIFCQGREGRNNSKKIIRRSTDRSVASHQLPLSYIQRPTLKLIHHLSLSLLIILNAPVNSQRQRLMTQRSWIIRYWDLIPSRSRSHFNACQLSLYSAYIRTKMMPLNCHRRMGFALTLNIALSLPHVTRLDSGSVVRPRLIGFGISTHIFTSQQQPFATEFTYF